MRTAERNLGFGRLNYTFYVQIKYCEVEPFLKHFRKLCLKELSVIVKLRC
jgi:hypothetical protein